LKVVPYQPFRPSPAPPASNLRPCKPRGSATRRAGMLGSYQESLPTPARSARHVVRNLVGAFVVRRRYALAERLLSHADDVTEQQQERELVAAGSVAAKNTTMAR